MRSRGSFRWTDFDSELLLSLTRHVRVFTVEQVARAYSRQSENVRAITQRRLKMLADEGLVTLYKAVARPELPLTEPLLRWKVGEPAPDTDWIAKRLKLRWAAPTVLTSLVCGSKKAAVRFGGTDVRIPRPSELSHDITLSGVYLNFRKHHPTECQTWKNEAQLLKLGFGNVSLLPDAMIERDGKPVAIEMGGVYSAEKLSGFHHFCVEQRVAYELW